MGETGLRRLVDWGSGCKAIAREGVRFLESNRLFLVN